MPGWVYRSLPYDSRLIHVKSIKKTINFVFIRQKFAIKTGNIQVNNIINNFIT